MVEHFRNRPIGSQISKENPAFAHMEAGTATKLLWRERKKFRKERERTPTRSQSSNITSRSWTNSSELTSTSRPTETIREET